MESKQPLASVLVKKLANHFRKVIISELVAAFVNNICIP